MSVKAIFMNEKERLKLIDDDDILASLKVESNNVTHGPRVCDNKFLPTNALGVGICVNFKVSH